MLISDKLYKAYQYKDIYKKYNHQKVPKVKGNHGENIIILSYLAVDCVFFNLSIQELTWHWPQLPPLKCNFP